FQIEDRESADQFFGLSEWAVNDRRFSAPDADPHALGTGQKSAGCYHNAARGCLFREFGDGCHQFRIRRSGRFRVPGRLNKHHESHLSFSFNETSTLSRTRRRGIDNFDQKIDYFAEADQAICPVGRTLAALRLFCSSASSLTSKRKQ